MNRLLAALLLCLLMPACALAFDLSPYVLPSLSGNATAYGITPLTADDCLLLSSEIDQRSADPDDLIIVSTLRWIARGECTRALRLPEEPYAQYAPVLRPDGSIRLVQATGYSIESSEAWKHTYTLCDLEGDALVRPRAFEGNPYVLHSLDDGFAGVCTHTQEQSLLVLYDADAQPVFRCTVPFERAFVQDAIRSGSALYLLVKQHGWPKTPETLLLRVEQNALDWLYTTADESFRYNKLLADGQGGVILQGSPVEDYRRKRMTHLNAEGKGYWNRTLSAGEAIVHPTLSVANPDGTATLYGYCVAKSRGLYMVFAMTINAQGDTLALDVRDYTARADTGPSVLLAADGAPLVYSIEVSRPDQPAVLVPFAALPAAEDPGITLH